MKYTQLLFVAVAVSAANVIKDPTAGYKEGDRFFYSPGDEDDILHLVDSHEAVDEEFIQHYARNPNNNVYWLFTRDNPDNHQVLHFNDIDSIYNSNFDTSKATVFLVHGWNGNGNNNKNRRLREDFLRDDDVNVIVLDWNRLANRNYVTAANGAPAVGRALGQFINWLVSLGASYDQIHLVGFSLGGPLVRNAGWETGGKIKRITVSAENITKDPTAGYKEGDRFFYFPGDGDHTLHLVDTQAPVDLEDNPDTHQVLQYNETFSVVHSNFDTSKDTVFLVHGWIGNGNNDMNRRLRDAFLQDGDVNIIVLDWSCLAYRDYVTAVLGVPEVGRALGRFINWLVSLGASYDKMHLVGFSLGGHVVGNAGRETGSQVRRITGLDPAGPLWHINEDRITENDAKYVEVIHTNANFLGYPNPCGDADFYPNGGVAKPYPHQTLPYSTLHFDEEKCITHTLSQFCYADLTFQGVSAANVIKDPTADYKEGDRFFYFPGDGDDTLHLVDSQEPIEQDFILNYARNPDNNAYWLFTRNNPDQQQVLHLNDAASLHNSNFDTSKDTVFLVHGWNGNGNNKMNKRLKEAFLQNNDVNIIVLDWNRLANRNYVTARNGVPAVGRALGQFINWLVSLGASYDKMHLVGFSLGAHLVGNAGRETGGKVSRITGLDPAGPLWSRNTDRITEEDAQYVEVIHTNTNFLGYTNPCGDADFYPNGGGSMPGCWTNTCSHGKAYDYMASTVTYNHLLANQCDTLRDATRNRCNGDLNPMGNSDLNKYKVASRQPPAGRDPRSEETPYS
ncbi:unnamed protein product [Diatraea saccharalis]|uniref:Lipase domain-containing protein n=1 Tax=Diatraea saccharalis TaxID=40085 RepID=A0A9N9WKE7_9NEOP|nr:unnamed protein product [Diatraea saccharalis]